MIRNSLEISVLTVKLQKPPDIIEPTIIHRSELEEFSGIIALMLMSTELGSTKGCQNSTEGFNVSVYNQIGIDSTSTNGPNLDVSAPPETIPWSDSHGNSRFTTLFGRPQGQADERHEEISRETYANFRLYPDQFFEFGFGPKDRVQDLTAKDIQLPLENSIKERSRKSRNGAMSLPRFQPRLTGICFS